MTPFDFQGTPVRHIEIKGTVWFHATDVCKCLGLSTLKGTAMHLRKLDADERSLVTPNQIEGLRGRGATFVTESGMNKLAMRADSAKAKPFQNWLVTFGLAVECGDEGTVPIR